MGVVVTFAGRTIDYTTISRRMKEFSFYCSRAHHYADADVAASHTNILQRTDSSTVDDYLVQDGTIGGGATSVDVLVQLLQLQLEACQTAEAPERTLTQQLLVIDRILRLLGSTETTTPDGVAQRARYLIQKACIVREVTAGKMDPAMGTGATPAPTTLCADAVRMLKGIASTEAPHPPSLIDDLASAYVWLGICTLDEEDEAGEDTTGRSYHTAFQLACGLWTGLLDQHTRQSDGLPAAANGVADTADDNTDVNVDVENTAATAVPVTDPARTRRLLHTLATLFGLLGQPKSQVLVYKLIALLNRRTQCAMAPATAMPDGDDATADVLARVGHCIQRMGYVHEAARHFHRADTLATTHAPPSVDFLLHFSQLSLAQGDIDKSYAQMTQAMTAIAASDVTMATTHAQALSFTAEIAWYHGSASVAGALAGEALKLRMKHDKVQSKKAAVKAQAARTVVSERIGTDDDGTDDGTADGTDDGADSAPDQHRSTRGGDGGDDDGTSCNTSGLEENNRGSRGDGNSGHQPYSATVEAADNRNSDVGFAHTHLETMAEMFSSLLQVGTLSLMQGFHEAATFYLTQGVLFATQARFATIKAQFLLVLADISCCRHEYDTCRNQLEQVAHLLQGTTGMCNLHQHFTSALHHVQPTSRASSIVGPHSCVYIAERKR